MRIESDIEKLNGFVSGGFMSYLSLLFYPALLILLFYGSIRCKKGEWNDEFMSLDQTKALLGFSSIVIIFHHLSQRTCVSWIKKDAIVHGLDGFVNLGYLFVALFFFCSGYGIFKSYKNKADYFDNFFVKRAFPILLTAFLSSTLFFLARSVKDVDFSFSTVFSIGGPSMLNQYGWYVLVILIMYFLFYLGFFRAKKDITGIITVAVGIIILILFCDYFIYGTWWYNTMHMFLIGIIFAKYDDKITAYFKEHFAVILSVCLFITVITFLIGNDIFPIYSMLSSRYIYTIDRWLIFICQMISSLTFVISVMMMRMKIIITNPILEFLGKMTLEIYLVHGLFVQLFSYAFIYDDIKPLFYIKNVFVYSVVVIVISLPVAFGVKFLCIKICEINNNFFVMRYDNIRSKFHRTLPIVLSLIVIYVIGSAATCSSRTETKDAVLNQYAKDNIVYASVGGLNMAAYDVGEGDHTVVMLGDIRDPMCVITLRPIADGLAEKGNRVILLDYFGRLFSDQTQLPRTGENCAKEIHEALISLGVDRPVILWAHTTAGIYATSYIESFPDEVEALVGADIYVGDAIYEMVKSYHSYDEMQRYLTKYGKQATISQKIRDYLSITNMEVTAYLELMYFKHTKEEKAAFEAAYGRYYNSEPIAMEYGYFIDDMKSIAGKKLPEDLPSLDMLSNAAVKNDSICKHWYELHENRITNPDIQTMVTTAYDSGFVYYNYAYPLSKTQEFIESLD